MTDYRPPEHDVVPYYIVLAGLGAATGFLMVIITAILVDGGEELALIPIVLVLLGIIGGIIKTVQSIKRVERERDSRRMEELL